ncbi:MAG: hypothetical protein EOO38_29575 [Cytophagaceae bacterium]|nr:MAG: hypothetical protein EOO38_29575 [Cytophagaceae bacterium]
MGNFRKGSVDVLQHATAKGRRMVVPARDIAHALSKKYISERTLKPYKTEWEKDGWCSLASGECPPSISPAQAIRPLSDRAAKLASYSEWYLQQTNECVATQSAFARTWSDYVDIAYVPFDVEQRNVVFAKFIREHGHLVDYYRRREPDRS